MGYRNYRVRGRAARCRRTLLASRNPRSIVRATGSADLGIECIVTSTLLGAHQSSSLATGASDSSA
jgi:hypothetical protein